MAAAGLLGPDLVLFVTNPRNELMVPMVPIPMLAPAPLVPLVPTPAHQAYAPMAVPTPEKIGVTSPLYMMAPPHDGTTTLIFRKMRKCPPPPPLP